MAEGRSWTPGKIFLLILAILAGLGILCCGLGYVFLGDAIKSSFTFGTDMAKYAMRMQKDYGKNVVVKLENQPGSGKVEFILTIGVPGDLTPARVTEIQ